MDIIKELWYGNVFPFEQSTCGDKQLKGVLKLMARNKEELDGTLTEKQKEKLEKFEENMNEMHGIAERERHRIANMPVDDYLYEWFDGHKRNVSKTTYDGYKKYIDLRIVPFFKELNLKVNEVTGDEINQFYARLTDDGLKGKVCRGITACCTSHSSRHSSAEFFLPIP